MSARLPMAAPNQETGAPIAGTIVLAKPPFFTPWTPPLGIGLLKGFLADHGYDVNCVDFNTDDELWNTHHRYFRALTAASGRSDSEGYSQLWNVLNAHLLAFVNGASPATIRTMLETIAPLYGLRCDAAAVPMLLAIVDRFFARLAAFVDALDVSAMGAFGTSTYTTSLAPSLFVLERIKARRPDVVCIMGGGVFADDLASGSDNLEVLLREYPFVDHIVLGEGELLLLKLLRGEVRKRLVTIADIDGAVLDMKRSATPVFDDFDLRTYYHLTLEGARSCPFQCSFCSETVQWGDYRKKPTDLLADQTIGLAGRYGNRSFFMGDSLMDPYIMGFSEELLRRDADIRYDGYLRADKISTDRARTRRWAASGLYRVRLGIESGSARVLELMTKMTKPETISAVLRSLAAAGIRTTTYWIVGFPDEREEDFQATLDLVRENHRFIYELEAHPFWYYPYGQIGSRRYTARSLYPDEVTAVLKFRQWEVADLKPNREEKFDRLRRIGELAADLGIPNIYTMDDRLVAEDRWRSLHPLAIDVYPSEAGPSGTALATGAVSPGDRASGSERLGYRIELPASVDEGALATAVRELTVRSSLLAGTRDAIDVTVQRDEKSAWALVTIDEAVGDAQALVSLVAQLFGLYQQIVARAPLSLSPLPAMPPGSLATPRSLSDRHRPAVAERTMLVEAAARDRLFSLRGARPVAVALAAAARSIPDAVTGGFTAAVCGRPVISVNGIDPADRVMTIVQRIEEAIARDNGAGVSSLHDGRVLVDCRYLVAPPWFDDEQWRASGFVRTPPPASDAELTVTIAAAGAGLTVTVSHRPNASTWADRIASRLTGELLTTIEALERDAAARRFWIRELSGYRWPRLLDLQRDRTAAAGPPTTLPLDLDQALVRSAAVSCDVPERSVVIAAFAAALAKRCGREDVALLLATDPSRPPVPIRLRPAGALTLEELARHVDRKVGSAALHESRATGAWRSADAAGEGESLASSIDVALVESGADVDPLTGCAQLLLTLVWSDEGIVALRAGSELAPAFVASVRVLTYDIVAAIAASPQARVADVAVATRTLSPAIAALAAGSFQFDDSRTVRVETDR